MIYFNEVACVRSVQVAVLSELGEPGQLRCIIVRAWECSISEYVITQEYTRRCVRVFVLASGMNTLISIYRHSCVCVCVSVCVLVCIDRGIDSQPSGSGSSILVCSVCLHAIRAASLSIPPVLIFTRRTRCWRHLHFVALAVDDDDDDDNYSRQLADLQATACIAHFIDTVCIAYILTWNCCYFCLLCPHAMMVSNSG